MDFSNVENNLGNFDLEPAPSKATMLASTTGAGSPLGRPKLNQDHPKGCPKWAPNVPQTWTPELSQNLPPKLVPKLAPCRAKTWLKSIRKLFQILSMAGPFSIVLKQILWVWYFWRQFWAGPCRWTSRQNFEPGSRDLAAGGGAQGLIGWPKPSPHCLAKLGEACR